MPKEYASFRDDIDHSIRKFLDGERERYLSISSHQTVTYLLEHLKTISAGGKRIRPFLIYCLYRHNRKDASPADIMPLLLAVELFHVFCLIHDDVMDEATLRHGVPTAHEYAQKTFYPTRKKAAESQAILIGDILFNSIFKLLHHFASQHLDGQRVISLFHKLIDEVCIGQMLDIDLTAQSSASIATITEKNRLKTAWYSIVRPLHLGLIVAKREDLMSFATDFGEQIGLLYQTQDDLFDVTGSTSKTKKSRFQDVAQNQHTILRAFIEEQDTAYQHQLRAYLGAAVNEPESTALEIIFEKSGAIDYAKNCIAAYQDNAKRLIKEQLIESADRELFEDLMNLITQRTT